MYQVQMDVTRKKNQKYFKTIKVLYIRELEQFKRKRWEPPQLSITNKIEINGMKKNASQHKKKENNNIFKKSKTAIIIYSTFETCFENELSLPLFKDDSLRKKILFIW